MQLTLLVANLVLAESTDHRVLRYIWNEAVWLLELANELHREMSLGRGRGDNYQRDNYWCHTLNNSNCIPIGPGYTVPTWWPLILASPMGVDTIPLSHTTPTRKYLTLKVHALTSNTTQSQAEVGGVGNWLYTGHPHNTIVHRLLIRPRLIAHSVTQYLCQHCQRGLPVQWVCVIRNQPGRSSHLIKEYRRGNTLGYTHDRIFPLTKYRQPYSEREATTYNNHGQSHTHTHMHKARMSNQWNFCKPLKFPRIQQTSCRTKGMRRHYTR